MNAFTLILDSKVARRLQCLAEEGSKSERLLAESAVSDFVERETFQIAEIKAGLAEAEKGEFATEHEMQAIKAKFGL